MTQFDHQLTKRCAPARVLNLGRRVGPVVHVKLPAANNMSTGNTWNAPMGGGWVLSLESFPQLKPQGLSVKLWATAFAFKNFPPTHPKVEVGRIKGDAIANAFEDVMVG